MLARFGELEEDANKYSVLTAIDYVVSLSTDAFVPSYDGRMAQPCKGAMVRGGTPPIILDWSEKMGKGDWRGISKNYVPSRTPTQVASHAQKYFIRQTAAEKRRRRSSLFDMPLKETISSPTSSVLTSNKAPDFSLKATTSAAPVASVRPPISPVPRTNGIQDFQYVPYMVGYPSNTLQTFGNAKCMPTLSFVPMLNYPNQTCVYPFNGHGNGSIAVSSPFMSQSSTSLLPQALPITLPNGPSEARLTTAVPKRDGLEASIGALSL